jgi:hypothetical protein
LLRNSPQKPEWRASHRTICAGLVLGFAVLPAANWSRFNSSWGTSQFRRPSGTSAVPSASPQP